MNLLIAHHAVPVDAHARSRELLTRLGIERFDARIVRGLPAGTARLVELACVLAGDPAVMLLDEPSAGLSGEETRLLSETLRRHQADGEHGALVVGHHMRFVMELSHRVIVLADGMVIADGPPERVREDERVRALYLGART
jgi:ABC-type branched-subunit amino acid transport system ATPase component